MPIARGRSAVSEAPGGRSGRESRPVAASIRFRVVADSVRGKLPTTSRGADGGCASHALPKRYPCRGVDNPNIGTRLPVCVRILVALGRGLQFERMCVYSETPCPNASRECSLLV